MYPQIIPIFVSSEEPKCPSCGKVEDTIKVCKHCKYEYQEQEIKYPYWYISILLNLVTLSGFIFVLEKIEEIPFIAYNPPMVWIELPLFLLFLFITISLGIYEWIVLAKLKK